MRILFACGGTAGHINPALAVASQLRKENSDVQILFVGNPEKMEARLVPKAGFDFAPLRIEGFQRRLTPENIGRNLKALGYLLASSKRVGEILRDFAPDIVMGTGGYVSGPVLRTAAKRGIPTLTHESNAYPGMTTRLLARDMDRVLLAVEKTKDYLPKGCRCIVTGNPVRGEFLTANRAAARLKYGIGNRVCVLSLGGSNGAKKINEAIAELIAHFYGRAGLHHIHATGRFGVEEFPALLKEKGIDPNGAHLDIREYIDDMADCFAAADLVIARSGAMTLAELQAAGKASVLIPSPNVAENHQYYNAMVLANQNAAVVIEERELTGEVLCDAVENLVSDPQELVNMGKNAARTAITDACRRICDEIHALYQEKLRGELGEKE